MRVAERINGATRNGDTVARLAGGDEFAVLAEDNGDPVTLASRIVDVLRTPFVLGGATVDVRASIGVFELGPDDAPTTADQLLIRADTAMYAAKRSGKDRIVLYRNGMSLAEFEDGELAEALRAAIESGGAATRVPTDRRPQHRAGDSRRSAGTLGASLGTDENDGKCFP